MRRWTWTLLLTMALAGPLPVKAQWAVGDTPHFEHSFWQWVEAAHLSPGRMKTLCPHLPSPSHTGDVPADIRQFDQALTRWTILYQVEYEALVNAPEMTRLNPYYTGFVQVYTYAAFTTAPITSVGAVVSSSGDVNRDQLTTELSAQHWFFVFQPAEYQRRYGPPPRLPEGQSPESYRTRTLTRLAEGT